MNKILIVFIWIENFDTAMEDFKRAIDLKKSMVSESYIDINERIIAELYYKMSMALELAKRDLDEAAYYVDLAIKLLKSRSESITKRLREGKGTQEDHLKWKLELEDLDSLFPDLEAKVSAIANVDLRTRHPFVCMVRWKI